MVTEVNKKRGRGGPGDALQSEAAKSKLEFVDTAWRIKE